MVEPIKVKNLKIGEGRPKICTPLVGTTVKEISKELEELNNVVDLVEWRVDYFENVEDIDSVISCLKFIREALKDTPLIFTFRTNNEGGKKPIAQEDYVNLLKKIIATRCIDIVDIELFFLKEKDIRSLVDYSNHYGVKVIISNHDFNKTPSKDEIISRLKKMQDLGAHIPKIALMPNSPLDVLELLAATYNFIETFANTPIITISMGDMGIISRISGNVFGSAMTFASLKNASAPGQISAKELKRILDIL